ncbi:MAG: hypothetical protein U0414_37645 [Polyangiaceae bacterium]
MTEPAAAEISEPTDLELMMYADGELDPERAAEVARFLGEHPRGGAGDKLFGLAVLSAHVRAEADRAATAHGADSIVASVFDAIRAEQEGKSPEARARTNGSVRLERSHAEKAGAEVVPLARAKSHTKAPHDHAPTMQKPANDNARLIFGLAGVAAAAAIALGIWGRGAPSPSLPVGEKVAIVAEDVSAVPTPEQFAEENRRAAEIESNKKAPSPVKDDTPAVAVAAVDFGTKTGAVIYVPSDSHGATTTVVWVSDE